MKKATQILKNGLAILLIAIAPLSYAQNLLQQAEFKSNFNSNHCKQRIENSIKTETGVKAVKADIATQTVTVQYAEAETNVQNLQQAITKLGYTANTLNTQQVNANTNICPKTGEAAKPCCKKKDAEKCKMQSSTTNCAKDSTATRAACCKKNNQQ